MFTRCFAERLEQGEHRLKRGVVGPIDRSPCPTPSREELSAILQCFCGLLHTPCHQYSHGLGVHTGIPSSLIAIMSKEDCSGPCSAASRLITTV